MLIPNDTSQDRFCAICGRKLKPGCPASADGIGSGCAKKFRVRTKAQKAVVARQSVKLAQAKGISFWDAQREVDAGQAKILQEARAEAELKTAKAKLRATERTAKAQAKAVAKRQKAIDDLQDGGR